MLDAKDKSEDEQNSKAEVPSEAKATQVRIDTLITQLSKSIKGESSVISNRLYKLYREAAQANRAIADLENELRELEAKIEDCRRTEEQEGLFLRIFRTLTRRASYSETTEAVADQQQIRSLKSNLHKFTSTRSSIVVEQSNLEQRATDLEIVHDGEEELLVELVNEVETLRILGDLARRKNPPHSLPKSPFPSDDQSQSDDRHIRSFGSGEQVIPEVASKSEGNEDIDEQRVLVNDLDTDSVSHLDDGGDELAVVAHFEQPTVAFELIENHVDISDAVAAPEEEIAHLPDGLSGLVREEVKASDELGPPQLDDVSIEVIVDRPFVDADISAADSKPEFEYPDDGLFSSEAYTSTRHAVEVKSLAKQLAELHAPLRYVAARRRQILRRYVETEVGTRMRTLAREEEDRNRRQRAASRSMAFSGTNRSSIATPATTYTAHTDQLVASDSRQRDVASAFQSEAKHGFADHRAQNPIRHHEPSDTNPHDEHSHDRSTRARTPQPEREHGHQQFRQHDHGHENRHQHDHAHEHNHEHEHDHEEHHHEDGSGHEAGCECSDHGGRDNVPAPSAANIGLGLGLSL